MPTNIIINIVAGTQQENVTSVTIEQQVWNAPFGQTHPVANGFHQLTVNKATQPHQISINIEARGYDTILNITVNDDNINVAIAE
ncbi:hypothetical protein QUF61_02350 [Candidatus Venteria ishoeyi]|uniref:hypothetical protein n=1 Tax=Candidatus Venteria ishoeyi TaxID=1899563 RepID=UPI0025A65900|nr:hypothetical protein [Candidatus Venteria ishoeyi]MDM8545313.1 hypothetical protein [Candidatus Venteria ishoeyi]